MSSSFASVLQRFDASLETLQSQVDLLQKGLDYNQDELTRSLREVHAQAASVRELVHAERPDARWKDRSSLDQLIKEIESAAQERQLQQRRAKLLDLADELKVGKIQHRFETRIAALDALRQEAIVELRDKARSQMVPDLPGPEASAWLNWVCSLDEAQDGEAVGVLRRQFVALTNFTSEMEARYWIAGRREPGVPGQVSEAEAPVKKPVAPIVFPKPSAPANGEAAASASAGTAAKPSNGNGDSSSGYEREFGKPTPAKTDGAASSRWAASVSAVALETVAVPRVSHCEKCGSEYTGPFHTCPVGDSATPAAQTKPAVQASAVAAAAPAPAVVETPDPSKGAAAQANAAASNDAGQVEYDRLKVLVGERQADSIPEEDEPRPSLQEILSGQRFMITAGAAGLVLVLAIIFGLLHFESKSNAQPAKVAAAPPPVAQPVLDADLQKQIDDRLATLKGNTIQASVSGSIVTLEGKAGSKDDLLKAEDLISQINGVRVIRDNIEIDQRLAKAKAKSTR